MADKRSQASSPQAVPYLDGSQAPYPNDPPVPYPVGVPHLPYPMNDGHQWQGKMSILNRYCPLLILML
ncbi:unnamed protein product [Trichobilharzia regenti]|nr:unnamed protein product [Trichobilharzia regenti]